MSNPFPGMNPWLESSAIFGSFHFHFIHAIIEQLQPQLMERGYYIDAAERIWVEESQREITPDGAVMRWRQDTATPAVAEIDPPLRLKVAQSERREPYLEIFDASNHRLVSGIEVLSPSNKQTTKGRRLYLRKQRELQAAGVNLVEIDLLRAGRHMAAVPRDILPPRSDWDYLVSIQRSERQDEFEVYPIPLRQSLPRIPVPLKADSPDVALDLQAAFVAAHRIAPLHVRIDYSQPPDPPLNDDDVAWATGLLIDQRVR